MENKYLTIINDIQDISRPIRRAFNLVQLNAIRSFSDGSVTCLPTTSLILATSYPKPIGENVPSIAHYVWDQGLNLTDYVIKNTPISLYKRNVVICRQNEKEAFKGDFSLMYAVPHKEYTDNYELFFDNELDWFRCIQRQDELSKYIADFEEESHELRAFVSDTSLCRTLPENSPFRVKKQSYIASLGLTPREFQSALLVLKGRSTRQAADELALSPRTVQGYIDSVKLKLDVYSKSEMTDLLLSKGVFPQLYPALVG